MSEDHRWPLSHVETPEGRLSYFLFRSPRRRSLAIHINQQAQVRVMAPECEETHRIEAFVRQHASWIARKLEEMEKWLEKRRLIPRFCDGEKLLFLGREYPLQIQPTSKQKMSVDFREDEGWCVSFPLPLSRKNPSSAVKEAMGRWYKQQALEILGCRVFHFSRRMELEPLKITVKKQKTMWGSCHPQQRSINLNWRIVMAPLEVIDYVVVHELCHIHVPNHSLKFWKAVEKVLPDYQSRHRWLKDNALRLSVEEP